jgi:hypothetical protein
VRSSPAPPARIRAGRRPDECSRPRLTARLIVDLLQIRRAAPADNFIRREAAAENVYYFNVVTRIAPATCDPPQRKSASAALMYRIKRTRSSGM